MSKHRLNRALSVLLAVLMLLSVLPVAAFAEDKAETEGQLAWDAEGSVKLTKTAEATVNTHEWEVTLGIEGMNTPAYSDIVLVLDNSSSMYYTVENGTGTTPIITNSKVAKDGTEYTGADGQEMADCRMDVVKATTIHFINKIWQSDSNVRFSLVVFGTTLQYKSTWFKYEDMQTLVDLISSVTENRFVTNSTSNGQTNIQAGIVASQELLQDASCEGHGKNIALLSDGAPSAGYMFLVDADATTADTPEVSDHVIISGSYTSTYAASGLVSRITEAGEYTCNPGYANTYSSDSSFGYGKAATYKGYWAYADPDNFTGDFKFTSTTTAWTNFGQQTVWQARQAQANGITVYTIGYWLSGESSDGTSSEQAKEVLKSAASAEGDSYFVETSSYPEDELYKHYMKIVESIASPAVTDGFVTDVMGDDVKMVVKGTDAVVTTDKAVYDAGNADIYVSQGTAVYDPETYTIAWTVGTVYESTPATMTYRVTLRYEDDKTRWPESGADFPTNEYAYLDYTDKDGNKNVIKHFPVPEVNIEYGDEGEFYVVHIQKATADAASGQVGDTETYQIAENPTFNITEHVCDEHLYGGTFQDVACTEVMTFNGNPTNFVPVAGETYYIWEVKQQYLLPYAFRAWYTTDEGTLDLSNFHILTPVDRTLYSTVGFDVVTNCTNEMAQLADWSADGDADGSIAAYGVVEMTYDRQPDRTDLVYLSNGWMYQQKNYTGTTDEAKDTGYIAVHTLTDDEFTAFKTNDQAIRFVPYWITLDGVKVTGIGKRQCDYTGTNQVGYTFTVSGSTVTYVGTAAAQNDTENVKAVADDTAAVNTVSLNLLSLGSSAAAAPVSAASLTMRTLSYVPVLTLVADAVPQVTVTVNDGGSTYTVSADKGSDMTAAVTPAGADGKLFAGWYTDVAYTTPADFSDVQSDMTVYAKYVSDRYLRVSCINGGLVFVRSAAFITSADSSYTEVGFLVNGEKMSVKSTAPILGVRFTTAAKSLKGCKLGDTFTVTAYGITADGTTVYGETETLTYTWRGLRG